MLLISARETRGTPEPGPPFVGWSLPVLLVHPFLVSIALPVALGFIWCFGLTDFPALLGSVRRSRSRWHFIVR